MALSMKQVGFCQDYAKSANGPESYRANYNAGKMKDQSVNRCALELLQNPAITSYVSRLRGVVEVKITNAMAKEELYDRKQAMTELDEALLLCKTKGNGPGMVAAIQLRAKLNGLIIDKAEIKATVIDELSDSDALAVMAALKSISTAREQRFNDAKTVLSVTE